MLEKENEWLSLIKKEELGTRFYNLINRAWDTNNDKRSKTAKEIWRNLEVRKKASESAKKRCENPVERKRLSKIASDNWKNNKEKMSKHSSANMKKVWKDNEYRENISSKASENTILQWSDLEKRENLITSITNGWTEEKRKNRSDSVREQWADPILREKFLAARKINKQKELVNG